MIGKIIKVSKRLPFKSQKHSGGKAPGPPDTIEVLSRIISQAPGNSIPYGIRAELYLRKGDLENYNKDISKYRELRSQGRGTK